MNFTHLMDLASERELIARLQTENAQLQEAARLGDWDTAVAYYRQSLIEDPDRLDVRVTPHNDHWTSGLR